MCNLYFTALDPSSAQPYTENVASWREVPAGPGMASASKYLSIPLPNGSRISVLLSLPFVLVHLASLLIFFMPFHWYYLVACLGLLFVRKFFVTAGYNRNF
jgi:hypothetical protein